MLRSAPCAAASASSAINSGKASARAAGEVPTRSGFRVIRSVCTSYPSPSKRFFAAAKNFKVDSTACVSAKFSIGVPAVNVRMRNSPECDGERNGSTAFAGMAEAPSATPASNDKAWRREIPGTAYVTIWSRISLLKMRKVGS